MAIAALFGGCGSEGGEPLGELKAPIVGGQTASFEQRYGTVALLTPEGGMHCTGIVIAPTVILTAAHCVRHRDPQTFAFTTVYDPSEVQVLAGSLSVQSPEQGELLAVKAVRSHPAFPAGAQVEPSGLGREDDIAVLLLHAPVTSLSPVPIMPQEQFDQRVPPATSLWLSGYGNDQINGQNAVAGVLRFAESPYQRRTDHELFVGGPMLPDSCPGDSGGPAYVFGAAGVELVGVNSRGEYQVPEMCGAGGMYTFASAYIDWITAQSDGAYPPQPPSSSAAAGGGQGSGAAAPSSSDDDDGASESAGCSVIHGADRRQDGLAMVFMALFAATIRRRFS